MPHLRSHASSCLPCTSRGFNALSWPQVLCKMEQCSVPHGLDGIACSACSRAKKVCRSHSAVRSLDASEKRTDSTSTDQALLNGSAGSNTFKTIVGGPSLPSPGTVQTDVGAISSGASNGNGNGRGHGKGNGNSNGNGNGSGSSGRPASLAARSAFFSSTGGQA